MKIAKPKRHVRFMWLLPCKDQFVRVVCMISSFHIGGPSLSILSPVDTKTLASSTDHPLPNSTAELLTAKAPMPLGNVQEEKKQMPELPPYPAQPPPIPTPPTSGRGRSRGRGRSSRGSHGGQNNAAAVAAAAAAADMQHQHQAYLGNLPPYSGYGGYPPQQIPGMAAGMQGFPTNPMMQPGANMMSQMNPSQFPSGQFPPGNQFPSI